MGGENWSGVMENRRSEIVFRYLYYYCSRRNEWDGLTKLVDLKFLEMEGNCDSQQAKCLV